MKSSVIKQLHIVFTGVCSNCHKLLGEDETKIAPQPSGIESEVILRMGDMSLVSVNHFLPESTINKMEITLTNVLSPDLTLSLLEEQFKRVPQMQQCSESRTAENVPLLPMGWALKASQVSRAQFNEKQKNYLLSKFLIGEQTGQKVNACTVACSMISARDTNGDHLFTSAEFLTGQQIASYFSRLASRRTLQDRNSTQTESDDESAEGEMAFSDLRGVVLETVQPVHPISFDNYNLCELMKESKLSKFAISMLNRICVHFEIPTCDITGRKKAPYLSRIEDFLKKCSCYHDQT